MEIVGEDRSKAMCTLFGIPPGWCETGRLLKTSRNWDTRSVRAEVGRVNLSFAKPGLMLQPGQPVEGQERGRPVIVRWSTLFRPDSLRDNSVFASRRGPAASFFGSCPEPH